LPAAPSPATPAIQTNIRAQVAERKSALEERHGGYLARMSAGSPAPELDVEALVAEVAEFLGSVPVAEEVGAKLSRLPHGFLEHEVLPQAERAQRDQHREHPPRTPP
jgi:hypothetical protein